MRRRYALASILTGTSLLIVTVVWLTPPTPPQPAELTEALRDVRNTCPAAGSDDYFLETDLADIARHLDPEDRPPAVQPREFRKSLSALLLAGNEPSLSCGPSEEGEVYRLVSLGAFHNPVVVHVANSHLGVRLTGFQTGDPGGRTILRHFDRTLSVVEWQGLATALRAARFWATRAGLRLQPVEVMDGGESIVEGRRNGRYHLVGHWNAPAAFREACLTFLRLAGVKPREGEIY